MANPFYNPYQRGIDFGGGMGEVGDQFMLLKLLQDEMKKKQQPPQLGQPGVSLGQTPIGGGAMMQNRGMNAALGNMLPAPRMNPAQMAMANPQSGAMGGPAFPQRMGPMGGAPQGNIGKDQADLLKMLMEMMSKSQPNDFGGGGTRGFGNTGHF